MCFFRIFSHFTSQMYWSIFLEVYIKQNCHWLWSDQDYWWEMKDNLIIFSAINRNQLYTLLCRLWNPWLQQPKYRNLSKESEKAFRIIPVISRAIRINHFVHAEICRSCENQRTLKRTTYPSLVLLVIFVLFSTNIDRISNFNTANLIQSVWQKNSAKQFLLNLKEIFLKYIFFNYAQLKFAKRIDRQAAYCRISIL